MVSLLASDSNQGAILPSIIIHPKGHCIEHNRTWRLFSWLLGPVGASLRDAFFLPLYRGGGSRESRLKQELAGRVLRVLADPASNMAELERECSKILRTGCVKSLGSIQDYFSFRDIEVCLSGSPSQKMTLRVFESTAPIRGKNLRVILFSFYGHTVSDEGKPPRRWEPIDIREVSVSPLLALEAVQSQGMRVNSLVTASLGNVAWSGLKHFSPGRFRQIIPPTIIINRGFTSVQKTAYKLLSFPFNLMLYSLARLSGWDADPEEEMLSFLEAGADKARSRKMVIIEATRDHFFSGAGRFRSTLHERVAGLGFKVFRGSFYPTNPDIYTHHALPLDKVVSDDRTDVLVDGMNFNLLPGDNLASGIARKMFFEGEGDWHTCFYVSGNSTTLDVGTLVNVWPLLAAFITEGKDHR